MGQTAPTACEAAVPPVCRPYFRACCKDVDDAKPHVEEVLVVGHDGLRKVSHLLSSSDTGTCGPSGDPGAVSAAALRKVNPASSALRTKGAAVSNVAGMSLAPIGQSALSPPPGSKPCSQSPLGSWRSVASALAEGSGGGGI